MSRSVAVDREKARRFDIEFAPRIASRIASLLDAGVRVEVMPHEGSRMPTRVRVAAERVAQGRGSPPGYECPLNVYLTWDGEEIERLFDAGGEERFARYLHAIPAKLAAWQGARDVDLETRSQAEFAVLVGGLDFEA
ncbi:hypothetical protein AWB67_05678 [Caballeronia terrestris]|uniref:DUF5594 domain-containing protein n=1 Tax=Caballeronia terrestris TaxID=1226301 RepID=A0A158KHV6_9BURK|nr:hypothetical protein AWB67_05678 [Caballeronia terrestris]